ncbi:ABC transporter permease [Salinadaptatus halalkaliphilus]|nr:ABC transporter permease [Salinadaptatus halalkaliphilus]
MASRPPTDSVKIGDADSRGAGDRRLCEFVSGKTLGFLLSASVLALGFLAHRVVRGVEEPLVLEWTPSRVDWLFLLAVAAFTWFVVIPVVTDAMLRRRLWRSLRADPLALASCCYLVAFGLAGTVGAALVEHYGPFVTDSLQPPGTLEAPLGADGHGQNLVALLLEGAGVSLRVAFVVAMVIVPTALVVGTVAGYAGGAIDSALMGYVDVQETVPVFLFYIVLGYVFEYSLFLLVVVFGLLGWGRVARLVRAEVRQLRERQFVEAARNCGCTTAQILRWHLLPNAASVAVVGTTQLIAWLLLVEAALAFMYLSDPNVASWGHTIARGLVEGGTNVRFQNSWWVSTMPMVALAGTVVALSVVGDWLRDALDPR